MTESKQPKKFNCTCRDWSQDICPGCKANKNIPDQSRRELEAAKELVKNYRFTFHKAFPMQIAEEWVEYVKTIVAAQDLISRAEQKEETIGAFKSLLTYPESKDQKWTDFEEKLFEEIKMNFKEETERAVVDAFVRYKMRDLIQEALKQGNNQ